MAGKGGPHFKGHKHSLESKEKIRKSMKNRVFSDEHRAKISAALKGRKHSPEHTRHNSEARKGRSLTEEHKKKVGDFFRGKSLTVDHRRKIGLGNAKAIQEGRSKVGRSGIPGDFYSYKNKLTIHYRSQLEFHWYELLELMSKVRRYHVEPVIIPYTFEGVERHYIPDLRIRYTDGTTELVEIKPESLWNDPKNLAKWKAAERWCEGRKIPTTFKVVGYEGLN